MNRLLLPAIAVSVSALAIGLAGDGLAGPPQRCDGHAAVPVDFDADCSSDPESIGAIMATGP